MKLNNLQPDIRTLTTLEEANSSGRRYHHDQDADMETVLAEHFLAEWQQAHGTSDSQVTVLGSANYLAVLITKAFTKAELAVGRQFQDTELVEMYVEHLAKQIFPNLVQYVEKHTGREVISTNINSNIELEMLTFWFQLGDDHQSKSVEDDQ